MDIYKASFITGPEGDGYEMYVQGELTYEKRKSIIKYFRYMVYGNIYSELMDAMSYGDDMRDTIAYNTNTYLEEAKMLTEFEDKFCNGEHCGRSYYFLNIHKISISEI